MNYKYNAVYKLMKILIKNQCNKVILLEISPDKHIIKCNKVSIEISSSEDSQMGKTV